MILVDTSIWVDHFRTGDSHLLSLIEQELVSMHPWVVGELACGNLLARKSTLEDLQVLPKIHPAREDEVLHFIAAHKLMGRGIGYVDMQLLTAARLNSVWLWSRDRRLAAAAMELHVGYAPPAESNRVQ